MSPNASGGGGGGGFDYVQDVTPSNPEEGEEWYDTGANAAFVYDGSSWVEETIVDHSQLSGVGPADHHSKPTGTQTAGPTGGYEEIAGGVNTGNPVTFGTGLTADGGRWSIETIAADYTLSIEFRSADGDVLGSDSINPGGSTWTGSVNFPTEVLGEVYVDDSGQTTTINYIDGHEVQMPSHSHSI